MSEEQISDQSTIENKDDKVQYSTYSKVLGEKKRVQAQNEALNAELADLRRERDERENAALAEQNKFKELYEKRDAEARQLQEQYNGLQNQYQSKAKMDAVLGKIGAPLLNDKYSSFIDLGSVDLEDAASIESAAASFRKEHGHLIQNSNPVHSQAPGTVSGLAKPIDEMSEKEIWASFNKE